ncbi:YadA-like family protein [Veillonella sp. CNR 79/14]|uniref:YadA-like family protein n=1 Tax=Veillonella sp. CNR 79/14 TaxID=2490954 RepID=UPI000F8D0693|nr:YadA-like family protein [Veillonella sp. CNR 79/14]
MNKLFKVIWSKSKQCYIVVSEVAKNTTGKKKIAVASVLAALAVSAQVTNVQAAIPEGTATNSAALAIGNDVKVSNDSSTGIGKDVNVTRRFAVAIGYGVDVTADNGVAIGSFARGPVRTQANGNDSIAIGTRTVADKQSSIAIGRLSSALTGEKGVAIGNEAHTTATSAIAIGNKVNATKDTSITIGNESTATGTAAVAYGNKAQATADSTVAVGDQSKATVANATAVGTSSEATEDSALAAGNGASATATGAVAAGKNASASGVQSIAIGSAGTDAAEAPTASGTQSIAIGSKTVANSGNSIAMGSTATASGVATTAIGSTVVARQHGSTAIGSIVNVDGFKSVGLGYDITSKQNGTTAIGYITRVYGNQAVAIGSNMTAGEEGVDTGGQVAIGYNSKATGQSAIGIGSNNTTASGHSTIALGNTAKASAAGAIAIGRNSNSALTNSVALGEGSTTTAADGTATTGYLTKDAVNNTDHGVVSVGNGGSITRRIISVASGTNDTDAVNVKQLKALRNDTVSTVSVMNGSTTTDLVPKTTEGDAEAHKVKLVAGKNITLTANGNAVTIASKSEVNSITSSNGDAISVTTGADGKVSVTPNLANDVTSSGDANKLVTAGKVKEALDKKVNKDDLTTELNKKANAADVTNLTNNKLDKSAELHVKKGSYAVDSDGSVTLDKVDGTGTVKTEEAVTITGIASKTALEHLKTEVDKKASKDDLDTKIGEVNAELATKVSNDTFREEMAKKADLKAINDLKDVLSGKVDSAALDKMVAALGNKVDETELNERLKTEKAENAAALKKAVDEAKAAANTGVNDLKEGKLDKSAELHVVKGEYEVDNDGTVTLKKANGENTEIADENVTIKGVASKAKLDEVAGKVTAAEGDITKLKAGVEENKNGLGDLKTKVDTVEGTANKAKEDLAGLTTKVDGIDGKVTAQGEKIAAADKKIADIEKNITDNVVTNDSMAGKLEALKTDLGANTTLSFAGDTTIDDKGTDAADDDNNSATKLSLNLKEKTLKVKGATDEITTEAKGDTITVGLSDKVKKELANISKLGDTAADGRDGKGATGKAADDPDATAADKGLTGQDGLNGKSLTDKVNALRNGEAGSVVYTDADGKRLVKANDGKYYLAKDVGEDGNKVGAAKAVEGDNLKASVVNPNGKGGPTTLSNLKDGKIAENSKDAVTGNQLHAAKAEVAKYLGGGATVDENGNVTEPTFTVKDKDNKDVAAHNVGDALSTMNERLNNAHSAAAADITQLKNMEGLTEAGIKKIKEYAGEGVDVKGDKNITVTSTMENGVKTFHATLSEKITLGKHDANDPDGDHANDPGVELDGHEGTIVAGDPNGKTAVKIDGKDGSVTAGKDDKQVKLDGKDGNVTVGTGDTQVKLDGPKGTVSTGKGDKEVKMNGADGTITAGDGANGKQVKLDGKDGSVQANKVTAGTDDKAVSLDGDTGTITAGKDANAVTINGTDATIKAGTGENQVGINGKDGSVTAKTVKAKDGAFNKVTAGKDDKAVSLDGDKGTITAGTGANAVSVDGTKALITAGTGENKVGINGKDGSVTAKTVTAKDVNANTLTLGDKDSPEAVKMDGTKGTITTGKDAKAIEVNGPEGTITLGKKDGDTKVELNAEKGSVTANMGTFGAPADANGVPTKAGVNTTTITDKGLSILSKNADGTVSKVEIKDGKITGLNGSDYNNYKKDKDGNVVKDKDGNPVVDSSVKMDGAGLSIAPSTGDPTKSVSLTKDGLNNGGNRITNVAPGVEDTDAVTVGQVKEVTSKLGAALEKTSQRVGEVGAHSAALAAMNPLSYDPLRKSQIMAGIGSYDGNQALALGIAHYANENFMFNAGITMGSGKSMANIGATYRFGTGDDDNIPERYKGGPISSVYVMQDEISALKAENARKDAENAEMKAQIKMLMERMGMA